MITDNPGNGRPTAFLAAYIALILLPVVWLPASPFVDPRWVGDVLEYALQFLTVPSTIVSLAQAIPQIRQTRQTSRTTPRSESALSHSSLALQVVVYAAMAVSWFMRLEQSQVSTTLRNEDLKLWYERGGWTAVNAAVAGVAQAAVLINALWTKHVEHQNVRLLIELEEGGYKDEKS